MSKKPTGADLSEYSSGGTIPEGILTKEGSFILPGISNSFMLSDYSGFRRRNRHLFLFFILLILELLLLFTDFELIGFGGGGGGIYDMSKIGLDMGGFVSRRRGVEIIEIDEIFGNLYVEDKKKLLDNTRSLPAGDYADGDDYGDGSGGGFGGAIDLGFRPDIRPPRLVTSLRKIYPQGAKEMNVEAKMMLEVVINTDGVVKRVHVTGIRLSKELPKAISDTLIRDFSAAARQIVLGAQFTPAIINGKPAMVKMESPLNFVLE